MKRLIALLLTGLLLCGCQKVAPAATEPEMVPTVVETTGPEETKTEAPDFSFGDLKEWEFLFSSGAGSWGTQLRIGEDGSFSGEFYDHDNETGEGYPNGIQYWCRFTGTFTQPQWCDSHTCVLTVETLEFEAEPGETEFREQMKYVADEPRGLALGEKFLLYLPDAPIEDLPEEFLLWAKMTTFNLPEAGALGVYGLYHGEQEIGFAGYNIYREEHTALEEVEVKSSALEEQLQNDGSLSQGDMNVLAGELYRLWDDELNRVWRFLKKTLDKDTMAALTKEQLQWIRDKEEAVAAAGAEAEGGSLQPLLENDTAATLTRERVYYLVESFLPE